MRYVEPRSLGCFLALYVCLVGTDSLAATLTASEVRAVPRQVNVGGTVSLASEVGEYVSGVQFDLLFDANVLAFSLVEPGTAALEADKDVVYTVVSADRVRVIISGLNQNVIPDGAVACPRFSIPPEASRAVYGVSLANPSTCDQFGDAFVTDGEDGGIIVIDEWPPEDAWAVPALSWGALGLTGFVIVALHLHMSGVSRTCRSRTQTRAGNRARGSV